MNVTFDHTKIEGSNIYTFYFAHAGNVDYVPGQFIELSLPHDFPDDRGQKRWFTLSSSPTEKLLGITTRIDSESPSTFKQALVSLSEGQEVTMADPMGDFVLPIDKKRRLVFIAGGIGITPYRSMVKWLIDNEENREIELIYGVNDVNDAVFIELFSEYGLNVQIVPTTTPSNWLGESGQLDTGIIRKLISDFSNKLFYISGPEQMTEKIHAVLKDAGVPKSDLVGDYFPGYKKY